MSAPSCPRLVFVVTEDWFFVSHFLPMLRAARRAGFAVIVVTRVRAHREAIEAEGAEVVPFEAARGSLDPRAALRQVGALAGILRQLSPDIVHCIALRSILTGGLAARRAGIRRRVYALTGLGFLGARQDGAARAARFALRGVLVGLLGGRDAHYLFENEDDPRRLGLDPADAGRVTIVGGAGIDPDALSCSPLPAMPPLKVALVARMLWSKGVDVAVDAVRRARAGGADVTLSLYGAPDPDNPKAIPEETLRSWSVDGIRWHGPTRDVAGVWREHHAAILPSRGGEGLPRTLLEAAACGRAILTTDVPGCNRLVRDGVEGAVVARDDAAALAAHLRAWAQDPGRVAHMGDAARTRVLDGFTEQAVGRTVADLYLRLMDAR